MEAKAQEGFAELRVKANKYDGNGASLEEAQKLVGDVKKKHPVFKVLEVQQDEGDFDVKYSYNPEGSLEDVVDKEGDSIEYPIHTFEVDGDNLTVYIGDDNENIYVRNNTDGIINFLQTLKKDYPAKLSKIQETEGYIDNYLEPILKLIEEGDKDQGPLLTKLMKEMVIVSEKVRKIVGTKELDLTEARKKFELEGVTGTYESMPKPKGDDFTMDHMPQAKLFKILSMYEEFFDNSDMQHRASGTHAAGAYAINLQTSRHIAGRTYGNSSFASAFSNTYDIKCDEIDNSNNIIDKLKAKREVAVDLLLTELNLDVAAMRAVYNLGMENPVWNDVDYFVELEDKETLVNEIKGRVRSGLLQIVNQPLDSLKV